MSRIREYFLLTDAAATAKRLTEDARVRAARQLVVGRQRAEAADALWSNGHTAEGLRLASEAFKATQEAVVGFAEALHIGSAADRRMPDPEQDQKEPANGETTTEEEAGSDAAPEAAEPSADPETPETASDPEDTGVEAAETDSGGEALEAPPVAMGDPAADVTPKTPLVLQVLHEQGASEGRIADVARALQDCEAPEWPSLDADVTSAHGERFQRLVAARRVLDRTIGPSTATPLQLAWIRVSRLGGAALVFAGLTIAAFLLLRQPPVVTASSSGVYAPTFPASAVHDGDPQSEWLLPDRTAGWVELSISPPQRVETLRLLNGHNRHYNDRAVNEYSVQIFSQGEVVQTLEGDWPRLTPRPEWTEHAVGADAVSRIRIDISSWHRMGAALAEVDWE